MEIYGKYGNILKNLINFQVVVPIFKVIPSSNPSIPIVLHFSGTIYDFIRKFLIISKTTTRGTIKTL